MPGHDHDQIFHEVLNAIPDKTAYGLGSHDMSKPNAAITVLDDASSIGDKQSFGYTEAFEVNTRKQNKRERVSTLETGDKDQITGFRLNNKNDSKNTTKRLQINNGYESVDVGLPFPVEDIAEITIPVNSKGRITKGQHPVVLLLHGQHHWLYPSNEPTQTMPEWAEDSRLQGNTFIPNYQGYRYVADALARDGRIVVSISANGINAQANANNGQEMVARANLVEHHLRALKDGSTGSSYDSQFRDSIDLTNTVLMGHSRGGEGVVQAAKQINAKREADFEIDGVMNFAPTNFSFDALGSIPIINLLPSCDGDVSSLDGQSYVERAQDLYGNNPALQSSIFLHGGNHNYLSTEWTPGLSISKTGDDDSLYIYKDGLNQAANGHCSADNRLTPTQVQAEGRYFLVNYARMVQDGDNKQLRLFNGSESNSPSLANKGVRTSSSNIGGSNTTILVPTSNLALRSKGLSAEVDQVYRESEAQSMLPELLTLKDDWQGKFRSTINPLTAWLGPDWTQQLPRRFTLDTSWNSRGTMWAGLDSPIDLSNKAKLVSRMVIEPGSFGNVRMALKDEEGRKATLPMITEFDGSLTSNQKDLRLWPQSLKASLRPKKQIDLSAVTEIGFKFRGRGQAWILDVASKTQGSNIMGESPEMLPSVTIETLTSRVEPGNQTLEFPVRLDSPSTTDVEIFYSVRANMRPPFNVISQSEGIVEIPAGKASANIPVDISWPEVSSPVSAQIYIYTLSGATVNSYTADFYLTAANGQQPVVTVDNPYAQGRPGDTLRWPISFRNGVLPDNIQVEATVVGRAQSGSIIPLNVLPGSGGSFDLTLTIPDNFPPNQIVELDIRVYGAQLGEPTDLIALVVS